MKIIVHALLLFLLILTSLTSAAFPGGSGTDVNVQESHGRSEGFETTRAASWTSFLDPSHITESMKDLLSPLHLTNANHASAAPEASLPDFWEMAKEAEETLQDYVHNLLEAAATYFKSTQFTDIKSTMGDIVNATAMFRDNINEALDAQNISFSTVSQDVEGIFMAIFSNLENSPTPDEAPSHAERIKIVDKIMDDATRELVLLATRYGIEEGVVTSYIITLKPQVQALIITVGDINEQCPQLLPIIAFSVAGLLIPESWILKPFLTLFGFGPAGPIQGSVAAWLQSRFWGAAVEPGSWFSLLQAAGMGAMPKWAGLITKVPMLVGLVAGIFSCYNRG